MKKRRALPKPKPKPRRFDSLLTHWKTWGAVAAVFATTCALVIQFPVAYHVIEPITPATSGYVRSHVASRLTPFELFQISSTVATERLNQTVTRENLRRAREELKRNPGSEILVEHVQQLEADIKNSVTRITEAEALIRRRPEGTTK